MYYKTLILKWGTQVSILASSPRGHLPVNPLGLIFRTLNLMWDSVFVGKGKPIDHGLPRR
jgi:hypothetical protein